MHFLLPITKDGAEIENYMNKVTETNKTTNFDDDDENDDDDDDEVLIYIYYIYT